MHRTMGGKAIALLSGGLDSMLAVRLMQQQGLEVEALNVRTHFTCCQDRAAQAARELGVRLTVAAADDDYLQLIKKPAHGYGRGANPCVDCRGYMFVRARRLMEQLDADLVVSGEVLGQRPMSQKRRDLDIIARESGLNDRLLRPLSAKLLPPTHPELSGLVDRQQLHGFAGRSRKGLIALARQFGFRTIPHPSTGCALTEPGFAGKVHDLVQLTPAANRWDFELLKIGRHVRFDRHSKVVVGRRAEENEALRRLFAWPEAATAALVEPENFIGPTALVCGRADDGARRFAAGLVARFGKPDVPTPAVRVCQAGRSESLPAEPSAAALVAATL